jgi:hypothetical protein
VRGSRQHDHLFAGGEPFCDERRDALGQETIGLIEACNVDGGCDARAVISRFSTEFGAALEVSSQLDRGAEQRTTQRRDRDLRQYRRPSSVYRLQK